ncbi:phage portal protein [Albimonas pacifica]|uniref:Phage portal protein, lambda family n=2 Tax=Albimonas TaxID=663242 RepID=A0A1I3FAJ5_9RHOB|nr:phage portal protein [Albimonas pacifica]SFI08246.1 phage portal protein, lambda family [Albimonas pacifica]
MLDRLRRLLQRPRPASAARSYDAAGGGRRWGAGQAMTAPNTAALAARGPILARARYQVANNGYAAAGVESIASALTGATGIRPQSAHPDPAARSAINASFTAWAEDVTGDDRTNLAAFQAAVARALPRDGEAFILLRARQGEGLRLQLLEPDQVDPTLHRDLGGGARIVAGIEFDGEGRRVAYHVFEDPLDQPFAAQLTPRRLPAADVLHVFRPVFPGQVRGLSWLAPILLRLSEHDAAEDALLVRLKTEAMFAGFIFEQGPGAGSFDGAETDGIMDTGLEPGTLQVLRPGQDIKFPTPPAGSGTAGEFLKAQLRGIAAGLGVTYEGLTADLSSVNYSSIRAGLIDFRRRMEAVQDQILIPQLLRPIWRRWLTLEVLEGREPAPGFEADPRPWLAAAFIRPGWPWVDPEKEIRAEAAAVEAGFKSRREVVAGRGRDLDQLDAEISADGPSPVAKPQEAAA